MVVKTQIQISTENPPIIEGITWKVLRGKSVSQTFSIEEMNNFCKENAKIFTEHNLKICILGYECGGGNSNTGSAHIYCGKNGEKLKGIRLSASCNSSHGMFISNKITEIRIGYWNKDSYPYSVIITEYWVKDYQVLSKEIGKMEFNKECMKEVIPSKFDIYMEAIEAGCNKATCYHCRCFHYNL